MKALTLWQPWAWSIFHGKPVENRVWAPPPAMIGQRIAIHAGKRYDKDGDTFCREALGLIDLPQESRRMGVIGTVTIDRVVYSDASKSLSPWFFGPVGWVLRDQVELSSPIQCMGALNLWRLPARVEAALVDAIMSIAPEERPDD